MPITAVLSRTLHESLGDEAAADLVDWMQQMDTHRLELDLQYARIDGRFNEARHATESAFGEMRNEFRSELTALRTEMRDGFADVRVASAGLEARMERRFADLLKWSFVFWCGTMALVFLTRASR
jgi:hypothetical protein